MPGPEGNFSVKRNQQRGVDTGLFGGVQMRQRTVQRIHFQRNTPCQQVQLAALTCAQALLGMFARLIEHVFEHTALGQPQIGQLPVPARQCRVQGRPGWRFGEGQLFEVGLDALVDVVFLLVEHRIRQQTHVITGVGQGQFEDRDRVSARHAPRAQQRRQAQIRVGCVTQDVLQTAIAKHRRMQRLRPERQLRDAQRLPGLLFTRTRPIQRREDHTRDAQGADHRDKKHQ